MGLLSKFENKMDDGIQGAAGAVGRSGLSPIQITKKAEKQMRREKIVGAGKQYAPTLYTVLVSPEDDQNLFKFYPTLAGETETYLMARARENGYVMDGHPLVRFLADPELKRGKFDVVAEVVAAPIISKLRDDEMDRYGIPPKSNSINMRGDIPSPMPGAGNDAYDMQAQDEYASDYDGYDGQAGGYGSDGPSNHLEVYLYDEERDTAYNLTGAIQTIGRETSNDVVVPDINISRVHAQICREPDGSWTVTDLNSTNGLFVNGKKVDSASLNDADMITMGTSNLEFQLLE